MSSATKQLSEKRRQVSTVQKKLEARRGEAEQIAPTLARLKMAAEAAARAALLSEDATAEKAASKARASFLEAAARHQECVDGMKLAERTLAELSEEIAALQQQADAENTAKVAALVPAKLAKLEAGLREYALLFSVLSHASAGSTTPGADCLHEMAYRALVGGDQKKADAFREDALALQARLLKEVA